MIWYALTIFWSAFLLFLVQPMLGKRILPWFGGTPAVWTTCLLFFQALLLAGYVYAHGLTAWLKPRSQALLHIALLAGSLWLLPIAANPGYRSEVASSPTWQILALLGLTIGAPYFLISATGPLLQAWFARTHSRSPYRLYALSNVGSLLALLSYPFVVEPRLTVGTQMRGWSWGYAAFAAACALCAVQVLLRSRGQAQEERGAENDVSGTIDIPNEQAAAGDAPPTWSLMALWLGLASCGSAMLMATTNQICQEVAVVPFLWILPLTLYLLSFIICFDSPRWYDRRVFLTLLVLSVIAAVVMLLGGVSMPILAQIVTFSVALFACTMACHGELVRSKPGARHLTLFYLFVASGGAVGGVLVALVAPMIFSGFWEYHLALVGCCVLVVAAVARDPQTPLHNGPTRGLLGAALVLGFAALVSTLAIQIIEFRKGVVLATRNFYGVLRVRDDEFYETPGTKLRKLVHGAIWHGSQVIDEEMRRWPTSYYGLESGVGLAVSRHPRRLTGADVASTEAESYAESDDPLSNAGDRAGASPNNLADAGEDRALRIGAIGLGAGTIAALGQQGDTIRFYDINPDVIRIAQEQFYYLQDSQADCSIALGDARQNLEAELVRHGSQQFDVLVMDAFSSDAIPMHLLTTECMDMYWKHLKPDGILAVNISNRNLDLRPVILAMAQKFGKQVRICDSDGDDEHAILAASWALITDNETFLDDPKIESLMTVLPKSVEPVAWTDEYGSLWQVLRAFEMPDLSWESIRSWVVD